MQHKSGTNGLSRRTRKTKPAEISGDSSTQNVPNNSSPDSRGGKIRKPKRTRRVRKKQSTVCKDDGDNDVQRKQEDANVNNNRSGNMVCFVCRVTQSPMWRKGGDDGNKILCNRCGLFWKRHQGYRPLCVKKGKRSHLYEFNFKKHPGRRGIKDKGSTTTDAQSKISDAITSSVVSCSVHDDGQQQQQQ